VRNGAAPAVRLQKTQGLHDRRNPGTIVAAKRRVSAGFPLEPVIEIARLRIERDVLRGGLRQGVQVRVEQEAGRVGQGAGRGQFHDEV